MTTYSTPSATGDRPLHEDARYLYELLLDDGVVGVRYYGGSTVIAGPVIATFGNGAVHITVTDRWADSLADSVVTMAPSRCTFGAIADIVGALARYLAVTA